MKVFDHATNTVCESLSWEQYRINNSSVTYNVDRVKVHFWPKVNSLCGNKHPVQIERKQFFRYVICNDKLSNLILEPIIKITEQRTAERWDQLRGLLKFHVDICWESMFLYGDINDLLNSLLIYTIHSNLCKAVVTGTKCFQSKICNKFKKHNSFYKGYPSESGITSKFPPSHGLG